MPHEEEEGDVVVGKPAGCVRRTFSVLKIYKKRGYVQRRYQKEPQNDC